MLAYQPVRSLATINMIAYEGGVSFRRISKIIDTPITTLRNERLPSLTISKSNIEFRNVSFSYRTKELKAVKDINLNIDGGSMVALVGHSGAGKSTMLNLLPRFYDPQEGNIYIDGQDINQINLFSLRKNISLVSQDVILFDDTIKNNIAYANPNASEDDIQKACKFASLQTSL